jgi:hypothetical protein
MMKSETEEENEIWLLLLFSSELPLIETRKHFQRERGNVFENVIEMK